MLTVDSDPVVAPEPMLDDSAAVAAAPARRRTVTARDVWLAVWPKVAAVAIGLAIWQLVVWSGWRPEYVLPPPATVILVVGIVVDAVLFGSLDRWVRRRHGLLAD